MHVILIIDLIVGICSCIPLIWNNAFNALQVGKCSFYKEWAYNPGSCGYIPTTKNIVALSPVFMPQSCGKMVEIVYQGKTYTAMVSDTCPSCSPTKIDVSDVLFSHLDSCEKGILEIQWKFV